MQSTSTKTPKRKNGIKTPKKSSKKSTATTPQLKPQKMLFLLFICLPVLGQQKYKCVLDYPTEDLSVDDQAPIYRALYSIDVTRVENQPTREETLELLQKKHEEKVLNPSMTTDQDYQAVVGTARTGVRQIFLSVSFTLKSDRFLSQGEGFEISLIKPKSFLNSTGGSEVKNQQFLLNKFSESRQREGGCVRLFRVKKFSKEFPSFPQRPFRRPKWRPIRPSRSSSTELYLVEASYPSFSTLEKKMKNDWKGFSSDFPVTGLRVIYKDSKHTYMVIYDQKTHQKHLGKTFSKESFIDHWFILRLLVKVGVFVVAGIDIFFGSPIYMHHKSAKKTLSSQIALVSLLASQISLIFRSRDLMMLLVTINIVFILGLLKFMIAMTWIRWDVDSQKEVSDNPAGLKNRFSRARVLFLSLAVAGWIYCSIYYPSVVVLQTVFYLALASTDVWMEWCPAERLASFILRMVKHSLLGSVLTETFYIILENVLSINFILGKDSWFVVSRDLNRVAIFVFLVIFWVKFGWSRYWFSKTVQRIEEGQVNFRSNEELGVVVIDLKKKENGERERKELRRKSPLTSRLWSSVDKAVKDSERAALNLKNAILEKNNKKKTKISRFGIEDRASSHEEESSNSIGSNKERIDLATQKTGRRSQNIDIQREKWVSILGDSVQIDSHFIPKWKSLSTSGLYSIAFIKKKGVVLKHTVLKASQCDKGTISNKLRDPSNSYKKRRGWMMSLNPTIRRIESEMMGERLAEKSPIIAQNIKIPEARFQEANYLAIINMNRNQGNLRLLNVRTKKIVLRSVSNEIASESDSEHLKNLTLDFFREENQTKSLKSSVIISPKKSEGLIRALIFCEPKPLPEHPRTPTLQMKTLTMTFRKNLDRSDQFSRFPRSLIPKKRETTDEIGTEKLLKLGDFEVQNSLHLDVFDDFNVELSDCGDYVFLLRNSGGQEFPTKKRKKRRKQRFLVLIRRQERTKELRSIGSQNEEINHGVDEELGGRHGREEEEAQKRKVTCYTFTESYQVGVSLDILKTRLFGGERVLKFGFWSQNTAYILSQSKIALVDFIEERLVGMVDLSIKGILTRQGSVFSLLSNDLDKNNLQKMEIDNFYDFELTEDNLTVYRAPSKTFSPPSGPRHEN